MQWARLLLLEAVNIHACRWLVRTKRMSFSRLTAM
jgi:hypothetical protein